MYLCSLGRVRVIDYKKERFEAVGQVDAVSDLIGGETATRSYAMVRKGAGLKPKTLAIMHGSRFTGDCSQALDDLNVMLYEVFGARK